MLCLQSAKLLSDVSVIQFYPSKFVLVTDILDTFGKPFIVWFYKFIEYKHFNCIIMLFCSFEYRSLYTVFAGRLVYDRLKEKAVYIPAGSGVARSLPGDMIALLMSRASVIIDVHSNYMLCLHYIITILFR